MTCRTLAAFSALALLLVTPAVAGAQTVAVLPPSGVNVAPGTLEAAQDVLRVHLAHTGKFGRVIVVPGEVGKLELEPQAAAEQGRAAGADLVAVLHLARLGSAAQVRLTAYATASGAVVYADRMPAASPDDLDRVLERLAKGMASGKPGAETAELDTVTQTEATPPLKRAATHVFGLGLGLAVPTDGGADAVPGLSLFWLYDARSFLADVAIGFHAGNSNSDVSLGIGAYYPLGSGDLTPYLGGGARWAATKYGGAEGSGIQLYAALGGLAGRFGSVQFRGQLEYFVNTFSSKETTYDYSYSSTGGSSYQPNTTSTVSQGLGVSIGIGF